MTFNRIRMFLFALPLAAGCMRPAVGPSTELVNARTAYARAQQSPAVADAPGTLEEARRALAEAERAHQADPQSRRERHLAALAKKRADIAIAKAGTVAAERDAKLARSELSRNADEAARAAEEAKAEAQREAEARAAAEAAASASQGDLARLEAELAETRRQLAASGATAADTQALKDREVALQSQIDVLRVQRDQAEQQRLQAEQDKTKAQKERDQALATIKTFATVDENDDRGLVITVPAEVVFRSGSARLLPRAREKLDELALALDNLGASTNQTFVIEGHTDSRGSAAYNQRLSKRRAQAVRTYLIRQGVDSDRIIARGKGESDPVAENTDAEGRANNRRVEIVVTPAIVSER